VTIGLTIGQILEDAKLVLSLLKKSGSPIQSALHNDRRILAPTLFAHEGGRPSPLHDDQILYAVEAERSGMLPA